MPITLQFPPTLRPATTEEIPNKPSFAEKLQEMQAAQLVPGYKINWADDDPLGEAMPFTFRAEINVDNDRLWEVIEALTGTMPEMVAFFFALENMEMTQGNYVDKEALMEDLLPYRMEICQDTFIECGFLYHTPEEMIDLYISRSKHLVYRGSEPQDLRAIMEQVGIPEVKDLAFIDSYPRIRRPLTALNPEAVESDQLLNIWRRKFVLRQ